MLYFNATDLKLEVLHIFVLLFSFLEVSGIKFKNE